MLLRRNEERIGRPHFYFADWGFADLDFTSTGKTTPSNNATPPGASAPTSNPATGATETTTQEAARANAAAAQEAARANTAAAAATARARDAAKTNTANTETSSLIDRAFEAGNNTVRSIRNTRDVLSPEAVAAGDKAYTEARAMGYSEREAQQMARDAANRAEDEATGVDSTKAGARNLLNTFRANLFTAVNTGPTYNPAETARANDTTNGYTKTETAIRAAIDNPSIAEETGAEAMEEVIKEAVKDAKNPAEAASKVANHNTGSAINILEKLSGGNISKPAARRFQIGANMAMAKMGYVTIDPFERAQLNSIEEFTQQLETIGANVEGAEYLMNQGKTLSENIQYNAADAISKDFDLTEAEIKQVKDALVAFNNDNATEDDQRAAFKEVLAVLIDKLDVRNQAGIAHTVELLIGLLQKQGDRCGTRKNEGAIAKRLLDKMKEDLRNGEISREVFDEFETEYEQQEAERRAEKGKVELFHEIRHALEQIEKLLNEEGRKMIPDELFAIQFSCVARVNALSKGWHLGSFLLKMVINFIALPFSPVMAIKGIISSIKGMTDMDNDLSNAFADQNISLVDFSNDESIKALAAAIVSENSNQAVLNAGDKMRNKAIKGIVLAIMGLFVGDVGLFAVGLVNALIYAARVQIIKTDLKWYLDNIDNVDRTLDRINSDAPEMKMNALGNIKQPTGELCRRESEYTYSNEYQNEWASGGNTNTEEAGGWNQGIASDEEVAEYIRQNFNRDETVRRLAGGLN